MAEESTSYFMLERFTHSPVTSESHENISLTTSEDQEKNSRNSSRTMYVVKTLLNLMLISLTECSQQVHSLEHLDCL